MSTDAPLDDLQWDAEVYDAERMRAGESSCLACGLHMVTTAAVDGTGQLVAFSQIVGYATSHWYADQWDTIVAPEHRGHRLGTLIKVANLNHARAQRPELRVIDTCNADSNPYMVAINEAMGSGRTAGQLTGSSTYSADISVPDPLDPLWSAGISDGVGALF